MKNDDYDYVKELKELRHLKGVVYQVLNDYEFPESTLEDEVVCVPIRTILRLSRAYSAIGFCNNEISGYQPIADCCNGTINKPPIKP